MFHSSTSKHTTGKEGTLRKSGVTDWAGLSDSVLWGHTSTLHQWPCTRTEWWTGESSRREELLTWTGAFSLEKNKETPTLRTQTRSGIDSGIHPTGIHITAMHRCHWEGTAWWVINKIYMADLTSNSVKALEFGKNLLQGQVNKTNLSPRTLPEPGNVCARAGALARGRCISPC